MNLKSVPVILDYLGDKPAHVPILFELAADFLQLLARCRLRGAYDNKIAPFSLWERQSVKQICAYDYLRFRTLTERLNSEILIAIE